MISVFTVLTLVVLTGHLLIRVTNRMTISKPATGSIVRSRPGAGSDQIPPTKLAVMTAVVDHITSGKGRIQSVRKLTEEEQKDN